MAVISTFLLGSLALKLRVPQASLPGAPFFTGLLLVAAAGFLDDRFTLPVAVRFTIQIIAAALVVYDTGGLRFFPLPEPLAFHTGVLGIPLALLWVLAVMNIYNVLDGIDGFATAQALIAAAGMVILDYRGPGFYLGALLFAASCGFLSFNWRPASLFLGDIGSLSYGYIFAALPFYFSDHEPHAAVYFMGILLWYFLADGAFVIIKRLLKKEKIWVAHRSHLYQRLTIAGLEHDQVVIRVLSLHLINLALLSCLYLLWNRWFFLSIAQLAVFFGIYYCYVAMKEKAADQITGE